MFDCEYFPKFGVRINNLDLSKELSTDQISEIKRLLLQKVVCVFSDQDITEEEQRKFASNFGSLTQRKVQKYLTNTSEDNPTGELVYHIEHGYAEKIRKYLFLYGITIPETGGNTLFSNTQMAYDNLPKNIKQKIDNLKALNVFNYTAKPETGDITKYPQYIHPLVYIHPETGKRGLFVQRLMTHHIIDEDGQDLLEYLIQHVEKEEFVYEHSWRTKDLVVWDNRACIHARKPFSQKRIIRRAVVE